ncbi:MULTISPECIES: type VI secretion system-associated protein TagO [Thiorhodovibrio]|uniref:type VI secretion system-associated protein TagO n=1 Tax=Thiorhodovibrio TaxID=61593 RepID=UPI0019112B77|nr:MULTISPECIES: type VI secretion system-associated protein TagO [Thiorhodovibrio]MBK5970470.1 hypothetical protein [Thiorhodovibrio winogradskyi]WPL11402.1 hypothetical protein Thiosp_01137 [Thiorhodovibrio litoralis]
MLKQSILSCLTYFFATILLPTYGYADNAWENCADIAISEAIGTIKTGQYKMSNFLDKNPNYLLNRCGKLNDWEDWDKCASKALELQTNICMEENPGVDWCDDFGSSAGIGFKLGYCSFKPDAPLSETQKSVISEWCKGNQISFEDLPNAATRHFWAFDDESKIIKDARDLCSKYNKSDLKNHSDSGSYSGRGKWDVSVKTNPLDDSKTVSLYLAASSGVSRWGKPIWLVLTCKSNRTDLYINWNDYLGSDAPEVIFRIGLNKAKIGRWSISTDNEATFYPGGTISIIKEIMRSSSFVAQVTPYNESPVTAIFETTGLSNAIKPLRETCLW